MAVPPGSVRVPSQMPLASILTSVTSVANDKGDSEKIPGAKTSARRQSDEWSVRPVIASNGVPFLQMRPVGPHRKGEGKNGVGSLSSRLLVGNLTSCKFNNKSCYEK